MQPLDLLGIGFTDFLTADFHGGCYLAVVVVQLLGQQMEAAHLFGRGQFRVGAPTERRSSKRNLHFPEGAQLAFCGVVFRSHDDMFPEEIDPDMPVNSVDPDREFFCLTHSLGRAPRSPHHIHCGPGTNT